MGYKFEFWEKTGKNACLFYCPILAHKLVVGSFFEIVWWLGYVPAVRADKATSINRMTHAPNGEPYPDGAGYVQGYLKQSMNGHSITTILNHKNDYVIFGKLIRRFPSYHTDVQTFYIPPYRDLKLRDLEAGSYKVHYEIVNTGEYLKNEPFTLGEMIDNDDNLRYPELILSANPSLSQITNHASNESEFGGF